MLFSWNIPPSPSPTESKRLFYTSVSLFLFCIYGYHEHLSKFHIYMLVYCNGYCSCYFLMRTSACQGFPGGSDGKESACNAGDPGNVPGSGRSPGEGKGYSLLYFCLENLTDREVWWATVHGVWKSWTNTTEQLTLSAPGFFGLFFSWRVKSHDSFDIGWHTGYRLSFGICFY